MDCELMRARLVKARTWMALNRKDFAAELRMSYRTVTNYENGSREPGGEYITRVANFCGVTTDWLLGLTDEPHVKAFHDEQMEKLSIACLELNEGAVNKVIEYAEDLAWNPANKK